MKYYTTRHLRENLGIPDRQAIDLSVRGVIIPVKDAHGAGSKRVYDYVNLLEFVLARDLLGIGLGIHKVKEIMWLLREARQWRGQREHNKKLEEAPEQYSEKYLKRVKQKVLFPSRTFMVDLENKSPIAILVISFNENDRITLMIPKNPNIESYLHEKLISSKGCLIIDLLKIKKRVDEAIGA